MADYSLDDLYGKLERADAAGDAEAASVIAAEIRRLEGNAPSAQLPDFLQAPEQAAPPDFSNVQTGSDVAAGARPSMFRADSDFRKRADLLGGHMAIAAAKDMFGSRRGAAEYLAQKARGKVGGTEDDPTVVLPDGSQYRLNDPGIDPADVANVAGNVAAFWSPASWASRLGQVKNLGLLGRAGTQALAAGGTDAALQATFDNGRVDPGRTAVAAAGGGSGEVLGSLLGAAGQRIGAARRSIGGQNAQQAEGLLRGAGVQAPTPAAVDSLGRAVPELQAGADPNALLGRELFGFQYTQGQRMTDPARKFDLLSQEELLRQQPGAAHVLEGMNRHNQQQLGTAVANIGERLGARAGTTPAELAQGAAAGVRRQADELGGRISDAYDRASAGSRAAIDIGSVSTLPDRLSGAVRDFAPDATLTPATARTLEQVRAAVGNVQNLMPGASTRGVTLKALETQRRIINNNIDAAANKADKRAMIAIKREFDSWLDEAVDGALISGDPEALSALKDARALRAEFGRRFEGGKETDKFIDGLLDGSRTPEELVNIALGAGQVSKSAGARFVERLRVAADNDPEVIGNLRAAHFQRLAIGNNGEPLQMGQIVRNIKSTEYGNSSVVKALYSPEDWAEIKALSNALDPLLPKGDFARTSGTAERMARMLFQRVGGSLPFIGETVRAVGGVRATVGANRAINQPLRLPTRALRGSQAVGAGTADEAAR